METLPKRLGPYEIGGRVGAGGMGVVYSAWDSRLKRLVAVKTLLPTLAADPSARERFLREARAAAAISHPNVTQIYDIGDEAGTVYSAMEYLEGQSLAERLSAQGPLEAEDALNLLRQAAQGLKAAADRGIIHRDVKPSNLFLTKDGTLKVTDFGLAKEIFADNNLTQDGTLMGTPNYISPEQASGTSLDLRSDIYSLGVTFYEMLCGRPPFNAESPLTVVMQHLREPVPPLREANPAVPFMLASLIQRMLSKSPGARPQNYGELLQQLDRLAAAGLNPPTPRRAASQAAALRAARNEPESFVGRLFAYTVVFLVLVGGVGFMIQRGTATDDVPPPATHVSSRVDEPPLDLPITAGRPSADVEPSAAARAELRIARTSQEITDDGMLRVFGQVTNAGPTNANSITLRVVLTDDEGASIDSLEVPVVPPRLAVGEDGSFEAFFPEPPRKVGVLLELNWLS